MTDKDKLEKAIRWFENIADECDKLTSDNVAHLRTQIKGMAIRSAEYLTKHSQEPASEDLERCVVEQMEADGDVDDFVRRGIDDIALKYAALGAQWQREQMMKDAIVCNYHKVCLASGNHVPDLTMEDIAGLTKVADRLQLCDNDSVKVIIIKE